jgi:hypothetical protein
MPLGSTPHPDDAHVMGMVALPRIAPVAPETV